MSEETAALNKLTKRGRRMLIPNIPLKPIVVLLIASAIVWAGFYRGSVYVGLLICWSAVLYGLSYIVSGARASLEEIAASPLSVIVSIPRTSQGAISYHKTAMLNDRLISSCAATGYDHGKTYYSTFGSGLNWFTDDPDYISSSLGVSEELIEASGSDMVSFRAVFGSV
jgi:hypothetical protein